MKNWLRAFILLAIISAYSFSHLVSASFAWSNGGCSPDPASPKYGTHDWIADHALDFLPAAEKQWILDRKSLYLFGTELPDCMINDETKHHVYFRRDGSLQDDSSAVRARERYTDAMNFLLQGRFDDAARSAGAMTHYISDLAVFAHVMGAASEWGAEKHHSDYEDWVLARTKAYSSEFASSLQFDGNLTRLSAYQAALNLANDTTFDAKGRGLTALWMDQNYNVNNSTFQNRAGESINLAVNLIADVLHMLWLESGTPIPEFPAVTRPLIALSALLLTAVLLARRLPIRTVNRKD